MRELGMPLAGGAGIVATVCGQNCFASVELPTDVTFVVRRLDVIQASLLFDVISYKLHYNFKYIHEKTVICSLSPSPRIFRYTHIQTPRWDFTGP